MREKTRDNGALHLFNSLVLVCVVGFFVLNSADLVLREKQNAALIVAIKRNDTASAIILLRQGADPNAADNHLPRYSAAKRIAKVMDSLLRLRPIPAENSPTALIVLCKPNVDKKARVGFNIENAAILRELLSQGANVNAIDRSGHSSLAYAVASGNWETAATLVQYGADVNARGFFDQPPLTTAITRPDLVRLLLRRGADVEARTGSGATPLMVAAEFNQPDSVRLLLAYGARTDAVDSSGQTALDYAIADFARSCIPLLIHNGKHQAPHRSRGHAIVSLKHEGYSTSDCVGQRSRTQNSCPR